MLRSAFLWAVKPKRVFLQAQQTAALVGANYTSITTVSSLAKQEVTVPEFGDHRLIFSHHSSRELWRNLLVLQTCAIGPLVKHSHTLLHLGERVLGERVLGALVAPFYRQFVAGDCEQSFSSVGRRLQARGVRVMLAPMLESDVGEGQSGPIFATNFRKMAWFLGLAAAHGGSPEGAVSRTAAPAVCQAKVTGHCSADVMEKVSTQYSAMDPDNRFDAILWTAAAMATEDDAAVGNRKVNSTAQAPDLSSVHATSNDHDLIDIRCTRALEKNEAFLKSSSCEQLEQSCPFELDTDDRKHFIDGLRRIAFIGSLAEQRGVVIAMDAEYTYVNPAINLVTLALMSRHNRDKPIIWNTYQAYLKDTGSWLSADKSLAERLGCGFGLKLVRGAYMDYERRRARTRGLADPVQDTYADTCANYDRLASQEIAAARSSPERHWLMLASHNEASVRAALVVLQGLGAGHVPNCVFAQVYGMAENISVPLAASGAVVYKSVPVGSVTEVLPYLARRASENRVVLQGARRERQLLVREIRDRAKGNTREV